MSLTDRLRDRRSPLRAYLEGISPRLAVSRGASAGARDVADALGLMDVASAAPVAPRPDGVDGTLAGTAFDFRARMELGGFDARSSAAAVGAARAGDYADLIDNGNHRATVLQSAFDAAIDLLRSDDPLALDRASILLAHCERVVRSGSRALSGSTGALLDDVHDGKEFAARVSNAALHDVGTLLGVNRHQVGRWKQQVGDGLPYVPNPVFTASALVGGADADWIVGDTLIECKVYNRVTLSTLREHLLQLLGYVMLDTDDEFGIRNVAIWLPRQQKLPTWSLDRLFGGDAAELLPGLRERFNAAIGNRQVAPREPISQRRKLQLLAENRHTPYERLAELSLCHDAEIRRRVGRNAVTPEATVRQLAADRTWRVREGVAMNEAAPDDVLLKLSTDRSKAVRAAVAGNPGAPRDLIKALTADGNAHVRPSARWNDGQESWASGASAAAVIQESSTTGSAVAPIIAERDHTSWDTRFVLRLVPMLLDARSSYGSRLPVPEASEIAAAIAGRDITIPGWLRAGLPRHVVEDLYRKERPRWFRQHAAQALPITDLAVRSQLLADDDVTIRWSALQRTMNIEAPDLAEKIVELWASRQARVAFRRDSESPYSFLTPRECDLEVLQVIASHRSTPRSVLAELAKMSSHGIRLALLENAGLAPGDRAMIVETLIASRTTQAREDLARFEPLSVNIVMRLAVDKADDVRRAVATRTDLSADVIDILARDPDWEVRLKLITHPSTAKSLATDTAVTVLRDAPDFALPVVLEGIQGLPESDELHNTVARRLDRLSKSRTRDPDLRRIAASHPLTPPAALQRLSTSVDERIREDVAGNSNAPQDVLLALADDDAVDVRAAVAQNPATRAATVADLSHDTHPQVRASVTGRADLDVGVLARLLSDDDPAVTRAALRHPSAQEAQRPYGSAERASSELGRRPDPEPLSREELEEMAGDSRAQIRISAAYEPDAPADILEFLGGERRSIRVRRAVASNPNAPGRLLRVLADDNDEQVRQAVAFNASTPHDSLSDLASRGIDLALLVALNPDVPDDVLAALASDTEPLVQHVAAGMMLARQVTPRNLPSPEEETRAVPRAISK